MWQPLNCIVLLAGLHYFWVFITFWLLFVDITFLLTLLFVWHYFFVNITSFLGLHFFFCWHYFFVDITSWLILLLFDISFSLTLFFVSHYFLYDITFRLTLIFCWHYFLVIEACVNMCSSIYLSSPLIWLSSVLKSKTFV